MGDAVELHCPIQKPLATCGYLHLNGLKLNKINVSLPWSLATFKCLIAACG